jgi:putative ABC transport system permease protein
MDAGRLEVTLGLRLMRKSWGLTLVGGLAMAVTIGLGTSIFTIWNTATATTLPLPEGDRIVAIQTIDVATQQIHRDSALQDLGRWREQLRSVTEVSAMRRAQRTVATPDGAAGRLSVAEMTAAAFRLVRIQPVLGRPLLDEDERGGAKVAVIGFDQWQEGFSSDPAVLGRRLRLDDVDYTVVGVMPEAFAFPVSDHIWIPLRTSPLDYPRDQAPGVFVFARLAPGYTQESAQAEVAALGLAQHRVAQAAESLRPRVVPYVAGLFSLDATRRWTGSLILLLAALLLLPPCANIGILVYARAVTRREEFATRYALGASRGRIVTQIFVEVLVLAAAAGTVGLLFASQFGFAERLSAAVLPAMGPGQVPFWFDFRPSLSTVLCLAGLVSVAAVVAGAVPGMRVTGRWRQAGLHALGARGASVGLGRTWTALLAMQVAIAVAVLPVGTQVIWGILKPSLHGPGMDVDRFLTGWLLMEGDDSRFDTRQSELVQRLNGEAAVSGVTLSADPLMDESGADVEVDGGAERATGRVAVNRVDPAFFEVFGARFRMGRQFDATDFGPGPSQAIIVTRTFAMKIAGTENLLGRRVRYVTGQDADVSPGPERWYEIVGVVEDFPSDYDQATVYHPLLPGLAHRRSSAQPGSDGGPVRQVTLTLRVGPDAGLAATRLREVTRAIDPGLRIARLQSLGDIYRQRGSAGSTLSFMLGSVMLIVVLFAMTGMYTLMTFIVAQRWREVGVRCALGASPRRLVTGIFGRSLVPLVIGAIVGCLLALLLDASIQVEDVGGLRIPGIVPATALVMILAGVLALAGPARRAIRINPVDALRAN